MVSPGNSRYIYDTATRSVNPNTDCRLIPRETRILPRDVNLSFRSVKTDHIVKHYFKNNPGTVRKGSISTALSAISSLVKSKPVRPAVRNPFYLPNEIVYQILSYFTEEDAVRSDKGTYREHCSLCFLSNLYNCCLISKAWNSAATATLYSKLKFNLDDTCEYHWRGIPWGDGVFWWARRTTYHRERYLKPLLRTLTAKPALARFFRTVEVDVHNHMTDDYNVIPLYTKIMALCPNLTSIIGDPCIFFSTPDPYLEYLHMDILNFFTCGKLHKSKQTRVLKQQMKLWAVLSSHTAWESWEWKSSCQSIQLPAFCRFHKEWKNLKHLSITDLHFKTRCAPWEIKCDPLGYLDSLESLSLTRTSVQVLQSVPANKLTSLSIENRYFVSDTSLNQDISELMVYLSKCKDSTSRLRKLSIGVTGHHARLTEKWLPRVLALTPNLQELGIVYPYLVQQNCILLSDDPSLETLAPWNKPFPRCSKLKKLTYLCPGWSHNELLAKLLTTNGVFPKLNEVVYYRSTGVVELKEPPYGYNGTDFCKTSKQQGIRVDSGLEAELIVKRGLSRVRDSEMDWRKVHLRIERC